MGNAFAIRAVIGARHGPARHGAVFADLPCHLLAQAAGYRVPLVHGALLSKRGRVYAHFFVAVFRREVVPQSDPADGVSRADVFNEHSAHVARMVCRRVETCAPPRLSCRDRA